jgi:hypothetical protein
MVVNWDGASDDRDYWTDLRAERCDVEPHNSDLLELCQLLRKIDCTVWRILILITSGIRK